MSRILKAGLAGFAITLAASTFAFAQTGDNSAGSVQANDTVTLSENSWDFNAPNGVPGFGPLTEGTDMNILLQQAMGQSPVATSPVQTDIARVEQNRVSLR